MMILSAIENEIRITTFVSSITIIATMKSTNNACNDLVIIITIITSTPKEIRISERMINLYL